MAMQTSAAATQMSQNVEGNNPDFQDFIEGPSEKMCLRRRVTAGSNTSNQFSS
jgi:hypothetical protein